ncbi:MAG: hypothetical protein ABWJ99_00705 [Caldimicrobium sp.]
MRLVISHALRKLEIAALTKENVIFKFYRAARNSDTGKVLVYARNPEAY